MEYKVVEHLNVNKEGPRFFMPINMKRILFLFVAFAITCQMLGQSRPGWTVKLPKARNNTYLYVVENASAYLEKDARDQAIKRVFETTAMRLGVPFDAQKVFDAVQQGTALEVISRQYNIPVYKVCEYTERIGANYRVYVLCQVATSGTLTPQFDYTWRGCNDDHKYSTGAALLSSAILPGLGQMGKRHYGEGIFTLLCEGALVGGAVTTYYMGHNELDRLTSGTLDYNSYRSSEKRYNTLHEANQILWIAAGVFYAFNLYRAITLHPNYKQVASLEPSFIQTPNSTVPTANLTLRF